MHSFPSSLKIFIKYLYRRESLQHQDFLNNCDKSQYDNIPSVGKCNFTLALKQVE